MSIGDAVGEFDTRYQAPLGATVLRSGSREDPAVRSWAWSAVVLGALTALGCLSLIAAMVAIPHSQHSQPPGAWTMLCSMILGMVVMSSVPTALCFTGCGVAAARGSRMARRLLVWCCGAAIILSLGGFLAMSCMALQPEFVAEVARATRAAHYSHGNEYDYARISAIVVVVMAAMCSALQCLYCILLSRVMIGSQRSR